MSVWRSTAQNVNEGYDLCKRRGKASLRVEGILKVVCVVRVVVADGGGGDDGGQDPRSAPRAPYLAVCHVKTLLSVRVAKLARKSKHYIVCRKLEWLLKSTKVQLYFYLRSEL